MVSIVPPTERECERCGRRDHWDDQSDTWEINVEDGQKQAGSPYCLHEWDINGTFNPVATAE